MSSLSDLSFEIVESQDSANLCQFDDLLNPAESTESIEDDVELCRNDSGLKADEILCNYGDHVLLDHSSEESESTNKPNNGFVGYVRCCVSIGVCKSTEELFEISPVSDPEVIRDKSWSSTNEMSSLGPSQSYPSMSEYLNSLPSRQQKKEIIQVELDTDLDTSLTKLTHHSQQQNNGQHSRSTNSDGVPGYAKQMG